MVLYNGRKVPFTTNFNIFIDYIKYIKNTIKLYKTKLIKAKLWKRSDAKLEGLKREDSGMSASYRICLGSKNISLFITGYVFFSRKMALGDANVKEMV